MLSTIYQAMGTFGIENLLKVQVREFRFISTFIMV